MPVATNPLRFGAFELDLRAGELRKNGVKIRLQEQPLQVLAMLLEHPGEVVTREELQKRLWPADTFVDFEHSLNAAVKRLREGLGDSATHPRFIETLPRHGYRFIAPVETVEAIYDRRLVEEKIPPAFAERRYSRRLFSLAAGGLVIVVAAVLLALNVAGLRERLFRATPHSPKIESIVVLPLENLSGDPEQEYFADGMTDALITELGKISVLRVISRTSAMHYKGTEKRLPEIARELHVDAIVEGTVQRSGDRIRITAQLLHAPTDRHLWAESYERSLRDVLTLQGEMAQAIAREIETAVRPEEQRHLARARPVNPEAYELYLKGRFFQSRYSRSDLPKAFECIQQAIEIDPNYAPAIAVLAACYYDSSETRAGDLPWAEAIEKSRAAALKALELDDSLADPHIELGGIHETYDWDWVRSEREFKRAIELEPNNARAHVGYAFHLAFVGRHDEAIQEAKRALELDPVAVYSLLAATAINCWAGRHDQAIEHARNFLEVYPNDPRPYNYLATAYVGKGMYDEADAARQKYMTLAGAKAEDVAALGQAYKAGGIKGVYRWHLKRWKERAARGESPDLIFRAGLHSLLGEKDEAFEWLEKAYQLRRDAGIIYIKAYPGFNNLRSDPRFQDLLRRMNFPE